VKRSVITALAVTLLAGGSWRAEACNPLLDKNFGKHVAPTVMPAAALARNSARTTSPATIVGLWHDVHTAKDGTLFLEGFDTWHGDGTEDELGNLPPATGPICVGAWRQSNGVVDLTVHVAWLYDTSNNFVGTLDIIEKNTVAAYGNSYSGTFEARFFDPTGKQFNKVTGTTAAERLVKYTN
jgi:hypothetical protein